jgi:hypothetical protein
MTDEQRKAIEWAIGMASQHNIHKLPLRELLSASKPAAFTVPERLPGETFGEWAKRAYEAQPPAAPMGQMQAAEIIKQWIRDHESELNYTEFARIDASLERLMMHLALAASPAAPSPVQTERGAQCTNCGMRVDSKCGCSLGRAALQAAPAVDAPPKFLFVAMDDDKRGHQTYCADEAAVRVAVRNAIYFGDAELTPEGNEEVAGITDDLIECGAHHFEGDAPLYLFRLPDPVGDESHHSNLNGGSL